MKKTDTYPTSSNTHADPLLRDYDLPYFIDMAPLEAAMRGLCVLLGLVIAQGGQRRLLDKVSRQILAAVKALTSAGYHNIRADRKLSMLASPSWRARVLRDLGGIAVLDRWERIMAKRRAAMDAIVRGGPHYEPRTYPSEAQRLARAANLKKAKLALFRKRFQQACRDKFKRRGFEAPSYDGFGPNTQVDRVKVDQEGEFRLAPLKRVASNAQQDKTAKHQNQTIKDRGPKVYYSDLDPIVLYPAEFYAAQQVDAEIEAEDLDVEAVGYIAGLQSEALTSQTRSPTIDVPPD